MCTVSHRPLSISQMREYSRSASMAYNGKARAAFFPRISLTAGFGSASSELCDLKIASERSTKIHFPTFSKSLDLLVSLNESNSFRKGVFDRNHFKGLLDNKKISVLCPYLYIGELVLFIYARDWLDIPFEISFSSTTFNEYVAKLENGHIKFKYDLVIGAAAAAGRLIYERKHAGYEIMDVMTGLRHRVISPVSTKRYCKIVQKEILLHFYMTTLLLRTL